MQRGSLRLAFDLDGQLDPVLQLMEKYASAPMSLADACLVRMTETLSNPLLLGPCDGAVGVGGVAQAVAEEVEGEHDDEHRHDG